MKNLLLFIFSKNLTHLILPNRLFLILFLEDLNFLFIFPKDLPRDLSLDIMHSLICRRHGSRGEYLEHGRGHGRRHEEIADGRVLQTLEIRKTPQIVAQVVQPSPLTSVTIPVR